MLIDLTNWKRPSAWAVLAFVLFLAACAFQIRHKVFHHEWPGGASVTGFCFGVAAGLIVGVELLLPLRKWLRRWRRLGSPQTWLRAHIWLGLLSLPLALFHSGGRLGGALPALTMIIFLLVILSGVLLLVLQNILPGRMRRELASETVYSEIRSVREHLWEEARWLVTLTCKPPRATELAGVSRQNTPKPLGSPLITTAREQRGRFRGVIPETFQPSYVENCDDLQRFYEETVGPYLKGEAGIRAEFADGDKALKRFNLLARRLPEEARPVLRRLADLCDQARELSKQSRMHFWLHGFLYVHLPLSTGLVTLLVLHIITAMRYW